MYLKIEELKKQVQNTMSMEEYSDSLNKDEPTVIFRNYNEPTTPPCMEKSVEIFNFDETPEPETPYGVKPSIPGINVYNAIVSALGAGSYCIHMADGSYTGYSIWEVREYIRNFDNTNLRTYISQTFDCDDFSQVLQGNLNGFFPGIALGTLWYGPRNPKENWGHSVNIFYSYTNNRIYLIEPQNDAFYLFDKSKWKPWMVII